MLRLTFLLAFHVFILGNTFSQELNCQVAVLTPKIQASDKTIYDKLQKDLRDFLNTKKWSYCIRFFLD